MTLDAHEKRLVMWWVLLAALTVISLEGAPALGGRTLIAAAVLVIAFVKVRIVIRQFMEIRLAPIWLQLVLEAWGAIVCAALLFMLVRPA